jgi:hypothetical protein
MGDAVSHMTVYDTETWPWHEVQVHDSETEAHAHALKVSRELGVEVAVIPCETQPDLTGEKR